MKKLPRLKVGRATADLRTVPVLETKAGATPRVRGREWMETIERIKLRDSFTCADCGRASFTGNQVDHEDELTDGGSNSDENLRLRCVACHEIKTEKARLARFGR